jgi:Peptidase MA superfamily
MRSRLMLIISLLCLAVLPVSAQDATPTPQPEQGFILGWTAESIYPAAVRFTIDLGRPLDQLTSADLLVQEANGDPITLTINLQDSAVVKEPYTQLAYVWTLPVNNPPPLFQDIIFKWRVISVENAVSLISDTLFFTDQRAQWLRDQAVGDGITLTLRESNPLSQIQRGVKPIYDLLAANTGQKPSLRVLLSDDAPCTQNANQETVAIGPVSQTEVPCDPKMADAIFQASDYDVVRSPTGDIADIQNAFAAYLTDRFYSALWAGKNVPAWFQSGLALFYAPTAKSTYGLPVVNAARTDTLFSLTDMANQPTSSATADFWTAQSYGMVVYIAAQIGVEGLFNLAKNIQNAESFTAAYQSALGQPLEALLPNLERWIFTNAGLAAFSFTPYQAATATPTATVTPTSTFTPTATASDTPTPTATVTGLLSLTPRPTLTPSHTPTAAPPSRTPRPPGSLNTATPTLLPPSAITQAVDNPRISLFVLVVGLLVIAISALLYRMLRGK